MMLGREVNQLTDLVFQDTDTIREPVDLESYLKRLKFTLEIVHSFARRSLQKYQYNQKRLHDLQLLNYQYEIVDLVYVKKKWQGKSESPQSCNLCGRGHL